MTDIYFVTNRNPNRRRNPTDFGQSFSSADIDDLRFGRATIVKRDGSYAVDSIRVAPERISADPSRSVLGSNALFLDLRGAMLAGVDTLGFIHGYNVSFHKALETAAAVQEAYGRGRRINVVVFSWPSDGSLLSYKRDRSDARASGPALARMMLKLFNLLRTIRRHDRCEARIHLMAHSMGSYVLRHCLQDLRRQQSGALPALFDQIFLMAADEDYDAFEAEHKLAALPEIGVGVNVYFNRGDNALVVSDEVKNNPARLGARGPRHPLNVPGNVTIVDASEVVGGLLEHNYFVSSEATVRDALAVLARTPLDRISGRRYVPSQNRYVIIDRQ